MNMIGDWTMIEVSAQKTRRKKWEKPSPPRKMRRSNAGHLNPRTVSVVMSMCPVPAVSCRLQRFFSAAQDSAFTWSHISSIFFMRLHFNLITRKEFSNALYFLDPSSPSLSLVCLLLGLTWVDLALLTARWHGFNARQGQHQRQQPWKQIQRSLRGIQPSNGSHKRIVGAVSHTVNSWDPQTPDEACITTQTVGRKRKPIVLDSIIQLPLHQTMHCMWMLVSHCSSTVLCFPHSIRMSSAVAAKPFFCVWWKRETLIKRTSYLQLQPAYFNLYHVVIALELHHDAWSLCTSWNHRIHRHTPQTLQAPTFWSFLPCRVFLCGNSRENLKV